MASPRRHSDAPDRRVRELETNIAGLDEQLDSKARVREMRKRQLEIMRQRLEEMNKKIETAEAQKDSSAHRVDAISNHMDNITQAAERKKELADEIGANVEKSEKLAADAKAKMEELKSQLKSTSSNS